MIRGFYNAASVEQKGIIAIDALHHHASERLFNAQMRLDPKSAFSKASRAHNADSLLGGLLLNMMTWGLLVHGIEHLIGTDHGLDLSHDGFFAAALESADIVIDETTRKNSRKLDGYPEGRRKDPLEAGMNRKFNLFAANQNAAFSMNAEAEVIALSQLLDMLEGLSRRGIRAISIDGSESVYKTLSDAKRKTAYDKVFTNYGMQVRKAI